MYITSFIYIEGYLFVLNVQHTGYLQAPITLQDAVPFCGISRVTLNVSFATDYFFALGIRRVKIIS